MLRKPGDVKMAPLFVLQWSRGAPPLVRLGYGDGNMHPRAHD